MAEKGPAERAPVLGRHVTLGDGDQACKPGLAGQQVVVAAVEQLALGLQTDVHEATSLVVQRLEVHRAGQQARAACQVLQARRGRSRAFHAVAQL